ncbi:MAG: hypothetical protein C6Y22_22940 [Hapalosiphonaceae cyanobacterium JJU2]|nr:MAG: hypothetical protein C6Y22_22940 [Hapalosiphonaceae cyanobacterium JJU2]
MVKKSTFETPFGFATLPTLTRSRWRVYVTGTAKTASGLTKALRHEVKYHVFDLNLSRMIESDRAHKIILQTKWANWMDFF